MGSGADVLGARYDLAFEIIRGVCVIMTDLKTALEEGTATLKDVFEQIGGYTYIRKSKHIAFRKDGSELCATEEFGWTKPEYNCLILSHKEMDNPLTNTDDALSLVPGGWVYSLSNYHKDFKYRHVHKAQNTCLLVKETDKLELSPKAITDWPKGVHESRPIAILLAILEIDDDT